MDQTIQLQPPVKGTLRIPGDKSISHRAIMLGSIVKGKTTVTNFLDGEDCLHTIAIFQQLGVSIVREGTTVHIDSPGIAGWTSPSAPLDCGNSGTTARLLLGILSSSPVEAIVVGDQYLSKRPMDRIIQPLTQMGATIEALEEPGYLPLRVIGKSLQPIEYAPPVASAQVKSAILFAAMQTEGLTTVKEIATTRDHTERMFEDFSISFLENEQGIQLTGPVSGKPQDIHVPGDISSAAFFLAAAAIAPGSDLLLEQVGLNETRDGVIEVLKNMGARLTVTQTSGETGEPVGNLRMQYAPLQATTIEDVELMPRLIDELPILALVATQAQGVTLIRNAEELRVRETDRITAVAEQLNALGAKITELPDGMRIEGPTPLSGGVIDSFGDHRLGMMGVIASLVAKEPITVKNTDCIRISYPEFFNAVEKVTASSLQ